MNPPNQEDLNRLLDILKDYFGDYLLNVKITPPHHVVMLVDTDSFTEGAEFIYNNLLFDTTYLTLVAVDEDMQFSLHLLMLLKKPGVLLNMTTLIDKEIPTYQALSPRIPPAEWHERELHDLFGIVPKEGGLHSLVLHRDWPRGEHYPMRGDFLEKEFVPIKEVPHQFDMPEGAGRHQVAVGPIHAGIIEPGHLRFSVTGEHIHKFDAQLFYTHKGIEKMAEHKSYQEVLTLAEHVCGLCAFSHSLAFSQALEALGMIEVPDRAISLRAILLEMERLASHFADLSAICSAGGFEFGATRAAYFRELILQLNRDLTGHRFLRDFNDIGGLKRNIPDNTLDLVFKKLSSLGPQYQEWRDLVLNTDSFIDRVEETGFLSKQDAHELGLVGPAARGSGIDEDMRRDFPYGVHIKLPVLAKVYENGDALARMNVRLDEVEESFSLVRNLISDMKPGSYCSKKEILFPQYQPALGLVESAKGSLLHWVMMGHNNQVHRWHVRSASYMNWRGMVQATMGNNIVPDAPLVNKSFNLCYACVDR